MGITAYLLGKPFVSAALYGVSQAAILENAVVMQRKMKRSNEGKGMLKTLGRCAGT